MADYLELSPSVEPTFKVQDIVKLLALGEFALTKFVSNVHCVLSSLWQTDNSTNGNVKALAAEDQTSHVLGLK